MSFGQPVGIILRQGQSPCPPELAGKPTAITFPVRYEFVRYAAHLT
jgi:hypothetical protein